MDHKMLREVQMTQLEIAKEFKKICDENNLTYIMEGGTLLGAVRHRGFIPWDDDMDFSMPRSDYERFFEITRDDNDSKYEAVNWSITKNYPHPFGKFTKKGTVYREGKMDNSYGIYIDIFPWDNWPDKSDKDSHYVFKLMAYRAMVRAKCGCRTYRANSGFLLSKWAKNLPFIIGSKFITKERLVSKYEQLCQKYNNCVAKELTCQCDMVPGVWNGPPNIFKDRIDLQFEDTTFKAPCDYNGFLTRGYGDYMQLPPEDKRGNQHSIVEVDFGN